MAQIIQLTDHPKFRQRTQDARRTRESEALTQVYREPRDVCRDLSDAKLREIVPMLAGDLSLTTLDRESLERVYTDYAHSYWAEMFVASFGLDRARAWGLYE